MLRIAEKVVRFVLLVLLVEFFSASFFTTPERSSNEKIFLTMCSILITATSVLKGQEEKQKEYFSVSTLRD